MPYFKILVNGRSCHGGNLVWSLPKRNPDGTWEPGDWHEYAGPLEMCTQGIHLTGQPARWWLPGADCYEAEFEGAFCGENGEPVVDDGHKLVCRRVRLLRKLSDAELLAYRICVFGKSPLFKQMTIIAIAYTAVYVLACLGCFHHWPGWVLGLVGMFLTSMTLGMVIRINKWVLVAAFAAGCVSRYFFGTADNTIPFAQDIAELLTSMCGLRVGATIGDHADNKLQKAWEISYELYKRTNLLAVLMQMVIKLKHVAETTNAEVALFERVAKQSSITDQTGLERHRLQVSAKASAVRLSIGAGLLAEARQALATALVQSDALGSYCPVTARLECVRVMAAVRIKECDELISGLTFTCHDIPLRPG